MATIHIYTLQILIKVIMIHNNLIREVETELEDVIGLGLKTAMKEKEIMTNMMMMDMNKQDIKN